MARQPRSQLGFRAPSGGGAVKLTPASVVVATRDQLSSQLAGETVILHMGAGVYFGLDEIGTRVWAMIKEPRNVRAICDQLRSEYEVEDERCQEAVLTLLTEMMD